MLFIDTGVLYSYVNKNDSRHSRTLKIMRSAFKGVYGKLIINNYVVDEALTLARTRTGSCNCSVDMISFIKTNKDSTNLFYEVILDGELLTSTYEFFSKYCEKGLSFTDCSILAVINSFKIENLASFDSGFSGLVDNIIT